MANIIIFVLVGRKMIYLTEGKCIHVQVTNEGLTEMALWYHQFCDQFQIGVRDISFSFREFLKNMNIHSYKL